MKCKILVVRNLNNSQSQEERRRVGNYFILSGLYNIYNVAQYIFYDTIYFKYTYRDIY